MATLVFFDAFIERLAEGAINLQGDSFKIALSNTAPDSAADDDFADIAEISAGNGYTAGGISISVASSAQSSGTYTLAFTDLSPALEATGTVGPFRYLVLYDDTHASDALVGYWDIGSALTFGNGDAMSFNFDAATITIAPA